MEECPVCKDGKLYTNKGVHIHIGQMARTDTAHRTYRDKGKGSEDALDKLLEELKPRAAPPPEPVYKESSSPNTQKESKRLVRILKSSLPEKTLSEKIRARLKSPQESEGIIAQEDQPEDKPDDPEPRLEMVTRLPILVVMFAVIYKAVTDWGFFTRWTDSDVAELYFYVFAHPSEAASIIILALTGIMAALGGFITHRIVWRFLFKDLQIRYMKRDSSDGKLIAVGTSKEGRIFLIIGRGFWDRLYRRVMKKPRPEVITVYFKRRGIINPFKVLASCDKGYLKDDPVGTPRFVTEGLFKRTLIATHLRRDTESNSTVYWFETDSYGAKKFDSEEYRVSHMNEIKLGLAKVTKACGMDATVQKDQMRNVISWLPSDTIAESKRVYDLKNQKMGPQVEP